MTNTIPEQNKALVLQAFDTLFNKRDYEAAARFVGVARRSGSGCSSPPFRSSTTSSRCSSWPFSIRATYTRSGLAPSSRSLVSSSHSTGGAFTAHGLISSPRSASEGLRTIGCGAHGRPAEPGVLRRFSPDGRRAREVRSIVPIGGIFDLTARSPNTV
jgi:hypothetical protein